MIEDGIDLLKIFSQWERLAEIGFIVLIGIMIWFWGIVKHHLSSREKVSVPVWLAFLSGKASGNVDPVGLSVQFLGLTFVLWTSFILLIIPPDETRGLLWQRGCLTFLLIAMSLRFILSHFLKKG